VFEAVEEALQLERLDVHTGPSEPGE
jgi:hypothetical protein